jgi:small subunit ribosomal protein S17
MADEETQDEASELAADAAPVTPEEPAAGAEPAADEQLVAEAVTDSAASEDPTAIADEASGDTQPQQEPASEQGSGVASEHPQEVVPGNPKERRRLARQRAAAPPAASRTPEQRQEERDALRASNAKARSHRRHKVRAKKPAATAAVETAEVQARGTQKTRQGIVVSDKAAKTITVRIDTSRRHLRYQKIVRSSKTLHAHDEHDEAHEGDLVRLVETRPLSATKRWRLVEVVERAR